MSEIKKITIDSRFSGMDPIDGQYTYTPRSTERRTPTKAGNNKLLKKGAAWVVAGTATFGAAKMASGDQEMTPAGDPTQTTQVVAEPGDRIWSLTEQELRNSGINPENVEDMRRYVDPNVELNGGANIQAGEKIVLQDIPNVGPPITRPPEQSHP